MRTFSCGLRFVEEFRISVLQHATPALVGLKEGGPNGRRYVQSAVRAVGVMPNARGTECRGETGAGDDSWRIYGRDALSSFRTSE